MKNAGIFLTLVCIVLLVTPFQCYCQVPSVENKDSAFTLKKATLEELYALDVKMAEKLTALKYDPSTKQSKISYPFDNAGSVAKVVLYYQNNRLIRIEKRINDKTDKQTSYSMFNFNEKNGCFANAQWSLMDGLSRVLTTSEYGLVYFGSDMRTIDLNPNEVQKLVQDTKDSLNTLMSHFKSFKYTFEIK